MTDPRYRQRHDHLMSSPLPLEPRTLADDPLAVEPCNAWGCSRCSAPGEPTQGKPEPYKPKDGDLQEALDYVRACVDTGDSILIALRSAVEVFATDPEPVAAQEPTAEPAQPEADSAQAVTIGEFAEAIRAETARVLNAAHAAEVERNKADLEAKQGAIDLLDAEVERLRGELATAKVRISNIENTNVNLRARLEHAETELAAARAELEKRGPIQVELAAIRAEAAALSEARAERPMPSDEELARMLWETWYGKSWDEPPTDSDAPYAYTPTAFVECARAAKAELLGVRRAESAAEVRERLGWAPLTDEQKAENLEHNLGAEPKGQPEPAVARIEATGMSVYGAVPVPVDGDGIPTKWRERLDVLAGDLTRLAELTDDRFTALERAVEGLKGGG